MKAYSDFIQEQLNKNEDDTEVVEVVEDHLMKDTMIDFKTYILEANKITVSSELLDDDAELLKKMGK